MLERGGNLRCGRFAAGSCCVEPEFVAGVADEHVDIACGTVGEATPRRARQDIAVNDGGEQCGCDQRRTRGPTFLHKGPGMSDMGKWRAAGPVRGRPGFRH